MTLRSWIAVIGVGVGVIGILAAGLVWHWQGNRVVDAIRERNNYEAQADTLRKVADGYEKLAVTASNRAQMAEAASESLREHLERTDRRLRTLTNAVVRLEDSREVETTAVSRGDSTTIDWQHADSTVSLAVALRFPGMIRPNPEPPVTGSVDVGVTIRPEIGISCDEERGQPSTNILLGDDRVTVLDLVTTVDEGVACLEAHRPDLLGSILPRPSIATGVVFGAGIVAGYMLAR